ncbi:TPA: ead/Ea22-like family protein [Klebsiella quasipneumoniae subsp. similipneumoniae]
MTTDITELAHSLKAAAENAIGAHERLAAYPYGEIIDISQHEGEQIDIDITDLNEFNKEANPVNILALVEALEKAHRYIDELREWNAGLAQESFERQQRISELLEGKVGSALLERENHHVEVVGKLTEHIDQLESRIVTVKLPYTPEPSAFAPWAAKAFYQFHKDTVKSCAEAFSEACSAAGVKLEIK